MARKGMTVNSIFDVMEIIQELDKQHDVIGFMRQMCEGTDKWWIGIDDEQDDNTLAYCFSRVYKSDDAIRVFEEVIKDCELEGNLKHANKFKDDVAKIKQNGVDKFLLPTYFRFTTDVLNLPYEQMKETVIHEYAHALVNFTSYMNCTKLDEDSHGTQFQETVKKLGGKAIHSSVNKDEFYDARIYNRAYELTKQYEQPFTVHYITYAEPLDKYLTLHTTRRKTNCKAIKELTVGKVLEEYGNWKIVNVYEVPKEYGREIVVVME